MKCTKLAAFFAFLLMSGTHGGSVGQRESVPRPRRANTPAAQGLRAQCSVEACPTDAFELKSGAQLCKGQRCTIYDVITCCKVKPFWGLPSGARWKAGLALPNAFLAQQNVKVELSNAFLEPCIPGNRKALVEALRQATGMRPQKIRCKMETGRGIVHAEFVFPDRHVNPSTSQRTLEERGLTVAKLNSELATALAGASVATTLAASTTSKVTASTRSTATTPSAFTALTSTSTRRATTTHTTPAPTSTLRTASATTAFTNAVTTVAATVSPNTAPATTILITTTTTTVTRSPSATTTTIGALRTATTIATTVTAVRTPTTATTAATTTTASTRMTATSSKTTTSATQITAKTSAPASSTSTLTAVTTGFKYSSTNRLQISSTTMTTTITSNATCNVCGGCNSLCGACKVDEICTTNSTPGFGKRLCSPLPQTPSSLYCVVPLPSTTMTTTITPNATCNVCGGCNSLCGACKVGEICTTYSTPGFGKRLCSPLPQTPSSLYCVVPLPSTSVRRLWLPASQREGTNDSRRLSDFVLTAQIHKFVQNAKVLAAYENYFVYASIFTVVFVCGWIAYRCAAHRIPCMAKAALELNRSGLVVLMFNIGMIFYAWMNTVKAKEKASERMDQCFGDDGEDESLHMSADPEWRKWAVMAEKLQEYSEYNVLDVVVSCGTIGEAYVAELVMYWVLSIGIAVFMTTWLLARRAQHMARREQRLKINGQKVECMPMEAVMRRSTIFSHIVYRGETYEELPLSHMQLLTLNDFLTSFSFDLVSFFFLQSFEFPGQMSSWLPWKLLWELLFTAILKGIFGRVFAVAANHGTKCGLFVVCTSICVHLVTILFCWITMISLLWSFWDDEFGGRLLHVLDIGVGVGLVGCLMTPVSIELVFAFTSAYWWEPRIRHRFRRVLNLQNGGELASLIELFKHPDRADVLWFGDEYVSSGWQIAKATTSSGDVLDGGINGEDTCPSVHMTDADFPISVHVVNGGGASCSHFVVVDLGDSLFGVDETMPVKPMKQKSRCCRFFKLLVGFRKKAALDTPQTGSGETPKNDIDDKGVSTLLRQLSQLSGDHLGREGKLTKCTDEKLMMVASGDKPLDGADLNVHLGDSWHTELSGHSSGHPPAPDTQPKHVQFVEHARTDEIDPIPLSEPWTLKEQDVGGSSGCQPSDEEHARIEELDPMPPQELWTLQGQDVGGPLELEPNEDNEQSVRRCIVFPTQDEAVTGFSLAEAWDRCSGAHQQRFEDTMRATVLQSPSHRLSNVPILASSSCYEKCTNVCAAVERMFAEVGAHCAKDDFNLAHPVHESASTKAWWCGSILVNDFDATGRKMIVEVIVVDDKTGHNSEIATAEWEYEYALAHMLAPQGDEEAMLRRVCFCISTSGTFGPQARGLIHECAKHIAGEGMDSDIEMRRSCFVACQKEAIGLALGAIALP